MTGASRRQRDLFENPPTPIGIPIDLQARMLDLLKELLTEAVGESAAKADDDGEEVGGDQDRA
jgi:hypothetical protein